MFKNNIKYENIKEVTIKGLVDVNYNEFYKKAFDFFEENNTKKYFNKGAFFAGPFWYIYRKMTFRGIAIIGIQVMLATLAYFLKNPIWISLYILSFCFFAHAGFFGTHTYYKKIISHVEESKKIDKKFLGKYYHDKKGVDRYMTGCWICGTIIIYYIALFL